MVFPVTLLIAVGDSISTGWAIFFFGVGMLFRMGRPFVSEILLLEKTPVRKKNEEEMRFSKRSSELHRSEVIASFVLGSLIAVVLTTMLAGLLFHIDNAIGLLGTLDLPIQYLYWPVSAWLVASYMAVFRFLFAESDVRRSKVGAKPTVILPVKICVSLLTTLFLLVSFGDIAAHAQSGEDLSDALKKYDYPWYDKDTDQLEPLETKSEAFPMSTERDKIDLGKAPKVKPTNLPPAGGPAGTTGNGWLAGFDFASVFMAILVAVIVCALAFLFYKFLAVESSQDDGASARRKKLLSESIEQLPFDLKAAGGDFRALAQQAYQAGDLRRAFIFLYSHVLVTLDQNERITLRKGKTNRQYLKEVWEDPKLSSYFKSVMLPFESAFFGDHAPAQDQFERCWSGLENFHSHLGQGEGATQ